MDALFSKETAFASAAALIIGLILGAKIMLFIAKVFGRIMGPSSYRNQQGGHYGHRHSNQDYENSNGLTSVLLFLLFIGLLAFMAKSFVTNFWGDSNSNVQKISSLDHASVKQPKPIKVETYHPAIEGALPTLPSENIPDFVTVENEGADKSVTAADVDVDTEDDLPEQTSTTYIVKVGVYQKWANAEKKIQELAALGAPAGHYVTAVNGMDCFAVYAGSYESEAESKAAQKALNLKGTILSYSEN